jgi:BirA family biotin operon repressor/biotin-[acetyl-CoA-carboxylase] ligase
VIARAGARSDGTPADATPDMPFISRREHLRAVGSTNDVVHEWLLEGTSEVCVATADEQTAGRGREARAWIAPAGSSLLVSLGFRPDWITAELTWRIAAAISLAMAGAAEHAAGLAAGTILLKWPNDLVTSDGPTDRGSAIVVRKLAGVLGESIGLGTSDPRVVVGVGVNADWPRGRFPSAIANTMTSLSELARDRPIDTERLLEDFLERLETAIVALRRGTFDVADWRARQVTSGRLVVLESAPGIFDEALALGVDARSGALVIADASAPDGQRHVLAADVRHIRLAASGWQSPVRPEIATVGL